MTMADRSIGVHALVWVGQWGEANARRAMDGARRCGYNRLEIPLLDAWDLDVDMTGRLLKEHGLAMTGNLFLTPATDITSADPDIVAAGERRLLAGAETVASVGGDYLCGTIYSMLGKYDHPATAEGRAQSADVLRRVADRAADLGVRLGLELCNRYETNLLNSATQALAMLELIDRPNVVVHLDTYHMNIEETDMVRPVLACGEHLGYVHIGESHRGYLGSGQVDFDTFFRALAQIGYAGPITFESFSSTVVDGQLSNALCIWRNPWTDSEDLAQHAHRFIEEHLYATTKQASEQ
jgi:D-psicose/D-tagatose/L-ribulose 3-epimerase